jgi:hypothetical protein
MHNNLSSNYWLDATSRIMLVLDKIIVGNEMKLNYNRKQ